MRGVVLKADQAAALPRGACSLDLRDIARQAEQIVAEARARADALLADARAEIERQRLAAHEEARLRGREEGLAQGRLEGREAALADAQAAFAAERAPLVDALTALLESFSASREQLLVAARQDVIVLAIAIAARVTGRLAAQAWASSAAAEEACEEALGLLSAASEPVVRVHPADLAAVEHHCARLAGSLKSAAGVRLREDESVGRGGIRLETADASVDATLASRIERIADELVAGWRERLRGLALSP
jgi:flagellar assembly protein FliH